MSVPAAPPVQPGLEQRARPEQERARKTLEHLLETAAVLLDEVGVAAFNTNLLAARAGVGIRTVYRYYPNKLSILAALTERIAGEWRWMDGGFERLADPVWDWRAAWSDLLDGFMRAAERRPGWAAVISALRVVPELRPLARQHVDLVAESVAQSLRRRGVQAPERELGRRAHLVTEVGGQLTDLSVAREGAMPADLVRELKRMQHAYLASVLDGPGVQVGRVSPEQASVCFEIRSRVFVEEQRIPESDVFDAADARSRHYVARRAGEAVGAARLRLSDEVAEPERVAVLAEHRGSGVGRALVQTLEREATAHGVRTAILHAPESAIAFFERLDYRREGEWLSECEIPQHLLRKTLAAPRPARGRRQPGAQRRNAAPSVP